MTQEADSRRCSSGTCGRKRPPCPPMLVPPSPIRLGRSCPGVPAGTGDASTAQAGGRGGDDPPGACRGLEAVPAIEDLVAQWLLLHHLLESVNDSGIELPVRPG